MKTCKNCKMYTKRICKLLAVPILPDHACLFPVVCVCGSTRYKLSYKLTNKHLTLNGFIVLTVGVFEQVDKRKKELLDRLHLEKIDMAHWIYVVNPYGYIGTSTKNEIEYAKKQNKKIYYMEG